MLCFKLTLKLILFWENWPETKSFVISEFFKITLIFLSRLVPYRLQGKKKLKFLKIKIHFKLTEKLIVRYN
jgi:nucleoside recognition membrane protein YjiH